MGKHDTDIIMFVKLAQKGESPRKLRGLIEHAPTEEIMAWRDADGLDLMQNIILANNSEVVEFMLQRGLFVRPHQPDVLLYSSLAALLGERTVLQILLQYRPDDYVPSKVPMKLPDSAAEKLSSNKDSKFSHSDVILKLTKLPEVSSTSSLSSLSSSSSSSSLSTKGDKKEPSKRVSQISESRSRPQQYQIESLPTLLLSLRQLAEAGKTTSPLDVAARAGHTECVSVILNQCVLKRHADDALDDKSDVTLACVADSPQSLALLLHRKSPDKKSWEKAVEVCLHHAHPDCLDLLLQLQNRETKHMFKGKDISRSVAVFCYPQCLPGLLIFIPSTSKGFPRSVSLYRRAAMPPTLILNLALTLTLTQTLTLTITLNPRKGIKRNSGIAERQHSRHLPVTELYSLAQRTSRDFRKSSNTHDESEAHNGISLQISELNWRANQGPIT